MANRHSGLSQDDFRKIIATPRHYPDSICDTPIITPLYTAPRSQKSFNPPKQRPIVPSNYRDRAAERREGANPDYVESENIIATLGGSSSLTVEESKFLGGDSAHTHLVKGLDFSLLLQEQIRIKREHTNEVVIPVKSQKIIPIQLKNNSIKENKLASSHRHAFVFSVLESALKTSSSKHKTALTNPLFFPGRMSFHFDLGPTAPPFGAPTVELRGNSSTQSSDALDLWQHENEVVATVLVALQRRKDNPNYSEENTMLSGAENIPAQKKKLITEKNLDDKNFFDASLVDESEDIFADVGHDYADVCLTDEALKIEPLVEVEDLVCQPTLGELISTLPVADQMESRKRSRMLQKKFLDPDMQDMDYEAMSISFTDRTSTAVCTDEIEDFEDEENSDVATMQELKLQMQQVVSMKDALESKHRAWVKAKMPTNKFKKPRKRE